MTAPRLPVHSRAFLAFWLAGLTLFWAIVLANLEASGRSPHLAATFRAFISRGSTGIHEMVWLYTGPRPDEGEVLRVFYRQGQGLGLADHNQTRLVAFLGTGEGPDPNRRFGETGQPPAPGFFEYQWVDLPHWPHGERLWLGLSAPAGTVVMLEQGHVPFDNLAPLTLVRGLDFDEEFKSADEPWFGSLHAMPVVEGAGVPSPARPFWFLGIFAALMLAPVYLLREHRRWWLANAVFQTVLLWKAMEVLFPSQYLWGGYHHHRTGTGFFWAGLLAVQALTVPWVMEAIGRKVRGVWFQARRLKRWTLPAMAIPGAAAVLYMLGSLFPCRVLYGDAFGALALPGYDYHNPFATGLYHLWRDVVVWWAEQRGREPESGFADLRFVARFVTLWAPVFAAGAGVLAHLLARGPREFVQLFAALLLSKTLLTHFGYAEVYGPAVAVQVWVVAALAWGYRRMRVVVPTSLSFFGYLFHLSGAMALPAVVVLWVHVLRHTGRPWRWLATRAAAVLAVALLIWVNCMAVLFLFKHEGDPESFRDHVPALSVRWGGEVHDLHGLAVLVGSTGEPKDRVFLRVGEPYYMHFYTLASWEHLSQIAGVGIFLGGPVLPWFLIGIVLCRRRAWRSPEAAGIALAGLAFLLSALLLATSFPYPKDWDVFSIHALWWFAGLFVLLCRGGFLPARAGRWMLAALLLYLLWDTLPWIQYSVTWGPPAEESHFVFI